MTNIHLGVSSEPSQLFVQWTLAGSGADTQRVEYGTSPSALTGSAVARVWSWADASTGRSYTHAAATLSELAPGSVVYYKVGSDDGWSAITKTVATRAPADFSEAAPLKIGWLGDLGLVNDQALPYLLNETLDLFIHVGDYAYDLQDANGAVGDVFEEMIEPFTSRTPYNGCPGNHEGGLSFAHYTNRFSYMAGDNTSGLTPEGVTGIVPGLPNNHYYSFNIANVHIVSMSTEAYFFYNGAAQQFAWLEADLAAVDRVKTPWLIVYGHRSIYCSCDSDCDSAATAVREGAYGMEALFMKYGVDIWVNGHEQCVLLLYAHVRRAHTL